MGIDNDPINRFVYEPLNRTVDLNWAGGGSDGDTRFSNYYDYFFSGEDVKVFIDGLFNPEDELDILAFSYSIKQEKQPLYGFWSYNYDAVMYGTRIVSGQFIIHTRYPRRMTDLLEKAARVRATNVSDRAPGEKIVSRLSPEISNTEDEANIQKYWAYSQLDRITYDPAGSSGGKNIFSAHPPFNFVILFGVEETALTPLSAARNDNLAIDDTLGRMMYSDVNQRSVRIDNVSNPMKIILQQVQLLSLSSDIMPGGESVKERYEFIARDFYYSETDLGFIRDLQTINLSDVDARPPARVNSTTTGYIS